MDNSIQKYYNPPQILFAKVNPREAYLRWGRGAGKTEGPICFRINNVVRNMARSNNAIAVPSYQKFLKDLLAPIRKGLALYGFKEGRDWVIGVKPPKSWKTPFYKPDNYDSIITFKNGTQYALFSQDSKTNNQGNSLVSVIGDEAKLLNFERIKEDIINAMRGGADIFGKHVEFNSKLFCSDGWRREKDYNWFFDAEKKANQEEMIHLIRLALAENKTPQINKILDYARKNTFFYHKASAVDNRHTLGLDYFKNAYENNTPLQFLVSNINFDMNRIEGSFYTFLNEEKQGYFSAHNSYFENLEYDLDKIKLSTCQGDADIIADLPLELSIDLGAHTNFGTVSQFDRRANTIFLLKDFLENKYEDILNEFNRYYTPFKQKNKRVTLFYDRSAKNEQQNSNLSTFQDMKQKLEKLGWIVTNGQDRFESYIPHNTKFHIWKKVLYEGDDRDIRYPRFRYNRVNAERTAKSMGMAPAKEGEKGEIKKDKSSERNKNIKPEDATHFSDTIDNTVCYTLLPLHEQYRNTAWI